MKPKRLLPLGTLTCFVLATLGCNSFSLYRVKGKGRVEVGIRTDTSLFLESGSEGDEATADLKTGVALDLPDEKD